MMLLDIPPLWHRMVKRHKVITRARIDHRYQRPAWTGALRLPTTHHECLTCGKLWTLEP